tara:strand:- start:173 stop:382 length:210 start_codon:yes stop_codon:yes gene_type:complete
MLLKGIEIKQQIHLLLHLHHLQITLVVLPLQLKWANMVPFQEHHHLEVECKEITHMVKEVVMEVDHQHL